jgi:hypothetical protein
MWERTKRMADTVIGTKSDEEHRKKKQSAQEKVNTHATMQLLKGDRELAFLQDIDRSK